MARPALLLAPLLLVLGLAALASGAPDSLGNDVYAMPGGGPKIVFIGSSPNVKLYPNSSSSEFLLLKFGSVAEATQDGTDIRAHTVPSLAALRPVVTTGELVIGWRCVRWIAGAARARVWGRGRSGVEMRGRCPQHTLARLLCGKRARALLAARYRQQKNW